MRTGADCRTGADLEIVSMHGGVCKRDMPECVQRSLARQASRAVPHRAVASRLSPSRARAVLRGLACFQRRVVAITYTGQPVTEGLLQQTWSGLLANLDGSTDSPMLLPSAVERVYCCASVGILQRQQPPPNPCGGGLTVRQLAQNSCVVLGGSAEPTQRDNVRRRTAAARVAGTADA